MPNTTETGACVQQDALGAQASTGPSQLSGQIKSAQGAIYTAVGSVIPESAGSSAWLKSGEELKEAGAAEVEEAKAEQANQAMWDAAGAKVKSFTGYLTGDQQKQTQGNVENEKAQWQYKQATSDSVLDSIPVPSAEGVKGKLESVVGMVTGDQAKQMEGNARAEKAAWTEGV